MRLITRIGEASVYLMKMPPPQTKQCRERKITIFLVKDAILTPESEIRGTSEIVFTVLKHLSGHFQKIFCKESFKTCRKFSSPLFFPVGVFIK